MPTSVKIGVIGAGSAIFSQGLIRDVCLNDNLRGSTITLMDIDPERLEVVHVLATRYAGELGVDVRFEQTLKREAALRDADFVINTATSPWNQRDIQCDVWEKHGFYRGEPLHQHANLQIMMDVAEEMECICPNAWLIQSGNPLFEGVTLMARETNLKIIGLCHGHFGYKRIARALGLDPEKMTCFAPGLNHLIYALRLEYDGRDFYPALDDWLATRAEDYWAHYTPPSYGDDQMSRAAFNEYRLLGSMPIGDTGRVERNHPGGWVYNTDLETKRRWYGPYGGFHSEVAAATHRIWLQERIDRIFAVAFDRSVLVTKEFPPVPTAEQQIPIIDSLVNNAPAPARICPHGWYQVNVPNQGAIEGIADDVAVEIPAVINQWGLHRVKVGKLPTRIMLHAILPSILTMERTVEAYRQQDWKLFLSAIIHDHRAQSWDQIQAVMADIFALPFNRDMAQHYGWQG